VVEPSSKSSLEILQEIRRDIGDCTRCKLSGTRTHIVYSHGSPTADVVFVGEAPGEDEDLSAVPFVGKAGQLLTKMIDAMGLTRDEVYICNILKCRPPENRKPEPDEVDSCRPFVERQIRAIQPKVIVVLGATAAQSLLRTSNGINAMRSKWHEWEGIPVMPTFHPSYLLRTPEDKKKAWEDLKMVLVRLGRQPRQSR
jgi:DNA polymerase